MTEDNLSKQVDEIEALTAIYPDEWKTEDESYRTYTATLKVGELTAALLITLPTEYPSSLPPYYLLTAPWMKVAERDDLYSQLEQLWMDHAGESILHLWIDKLREHLQSIASAKLHIAETSPKKNDEPTDKKTTLDNCVDLSEGECPLITSAEPFSDRKSTFQGHAATVTSVKQVKQVLAKLCENRKIAQATHNMYAYRIYNEETKMWLQDCEDDGEDHAGGRVMHLLQILDVTNVVVVVSRWFGGILLGGDRFKFINNAARDALELGHFIPNSKDDANKKKIKKK